MIEKATFFQTGTEAEKAFKTGVVEEILVRFSQLVIDFPEIKEIDINPLIVTPENALAVDARITMDMDRVRREQADHHEHLVIAPYPKKYITHRTLKNGLQVTLRPIKPEDEAGFNELFKSLSEESVRFRFFEIIKEMSHDTLSRYCNLDYDREIAIVAQLQNDGRLVGVVRLIPDLDMKHGDIIGVSYSLRRMNHKNTSAGRISKTHLQYVSEPFKRGLLKNIDGIGHATIIWQNAPQSRKRSFTYP